MSNGTSWCVLQSNQKRDGRISNCACSIVNFRHKSYRQQTFGNIANAFKNVGQVCSVFTAFVVTNSEIP